MTELVLKPMTADEAKQCINEINSGLLAVRHRLLDLYERDGWKALGYDSWRACAMAEFSFNQSHVYRLLEAAEIERNVSPIGETDRQIPESHLRPLASLEPETQRKAWQEAKDTAPNGKVTAAHVEVIVAQYKPTSPPAAPPPRREYESAVPLITPAIIEPEPRRAATPAIIAEPDPEPEAEKEPKDNDEYYTPSYILDPARQVLGSIDLDPASCADANEIVGATKFYDKAINGLIFPWFGQIWLNPPYSDPLPWIERLFQQYAAGKTTGAMVLVNTTNSPRWARLLWQSEHRVCLLGKRIKFWRADQPEGKGFDRDQMIWYLGDDPQLFADVFSELGSIR